jgi:hypothetical protein
MKRRPVLFLLFAILFIFISDTDSYGQGKSVQPLPDKKVMEWQGDYSRFKEPGAMVIKNLETLQRVTGSDRDIDPGIDFSRYMVIAVFMGEKMTGGYGINILRAEEVESVELVPLPNSGVWDTHIDEVRQANSILCGRQKVFIVEYEEVSPGPGSIVTEALTAPYAIKVVKRSDLPVLFVRYKKERR